MQSGLHGRLEELGLDEILQIVGVSRRTGTLSLKSRGREAVLHFREGLLVRVTSTGFQQSLGELLVRKGAVAPEVLNQALIVQQQQGFQQRIGTILHQHFKVDLLMIEQTVREQITNVLMTLFAWTEGSFDCSSREVETVDAAYLDPVQLILELGESATDQLVAAGIQMQNDLGADKGQDLPLTPASVPIVEAKPVRPALVVIDDDSAMAEALAAGFQEWFDTTPLMRSEEALVTIDALHRSGNSPVVLIDLIMPKMDGTGVLGGLELIRLLHRNFKALTIIALSDFHHDDAVKELAELGYPCFIKPRRGDTKGEQFAELMLRLKEQLTLQ